MGYRIIFFLEVGAVFGLVFFNFHRINFRVLCLNLYQWVRGFYFILCGIFRLIELRRIVVFRNYILEVHSFSFFIVFLFGQCPYKNILVLFVFHSHRLLKLEL